MNKFKYIQGEDLILDHLKSYLSYKATTGVFTWKRSRFNRVLKVGQKAGSKSRYGYIVINLQGCSYPAHRLAWYFIYGYMPENDIDHKNGIRDDNRICNLREATRLQNLQNQRKAHKDAKVQLLGVSLYKTKK